MSLQGLIRGKHFLTLTRDDITDEFINMLIYTKDKILSVIDTPVSTMNMIILVFLYFFKKKTFSNASNEYILYMLQKFIYYRKFSREAEK